MNLNYGKILSENSAEDFIGRTREINALLSHSRGEWKTNSLLLLAAPKLGASELLRQTFDRLFAENGEIVPFYFAVKKSDKTAKQCAVRFLQTFLLQIVAFRRQDKKIFDASPEICELTEIAPPTDGYWIDRIVDTCLRESRLNNDRAFVRQALSAPLRAVNTRFFVMIDNLHEAANFTDDVDFIEEIREIYFRSSVNFVFSGHRRFVFEKFHGKSPSFELKPLDFKQSGLLAESSARKFEVKINDQTRDLIAVKFAGNPFLISSIFQAASEKERDLSSFERVEQVYADEVFGGRISKFYEAIFEELSLDVEIQKNFAGLIFDSLTTERKKSPIEVWQRRSGLNVSDFRRALRFLNEREIVRVSTNLVEAMHENEVLSDYIKARFRLETIEENRASVIGETLSEFVKRAPQTMARFYRKSSAIGLRELLSVFDNQETPLVLLDYERFKQSYKGLKDEEIFENLPNEMANIVLPQIIYTAHTVAFYPPLEQFTEKERSAVALGFEHSVYSEDGEIVWLAAEIDSKLEANKEVTEFWCDRLEMAALMCNFPKNQIWLIAPEGFSDEALEILSQRNAFGSSKKQVELLVKFLNAEDVIEKKSPQNEYEIIIPMGEDTEMIAAQTLEEIARRHNFAPRTINQIKTALVEACINAAEHSLSPDRKIYQKFAVEDDKIIITVSNRGLRLTDKTAQEITPNEGRRGWGLNLMKSLMDDVKIEQVDDGTRISMVKNL